MTFRSATPRLPLLLSCLLLAPLAHGQQSAQTSLERITVEGSAINKKSLGLKAIQSSASRLELSALDTAASIELLDVERARARGDALVSELVSRGTGISAMGSPGSGSTYSSRGFTGNDSVAQAEDGLRMATASGTQSSPSDSFGYERIELLRGPASVLYGDGAIGGLINLVRKAPGPLASSELTAGLGSYGDYRLGMGLNRPLGESSALRIDALTKGGDGFVERGRHRNSKLLSTWRWEASPNVRLDLSLDIHRDRPTAYFGTPLRSDGSLWRDLQRENYNVADALWRMDQERARARLDWQLGDGLSARAVAYRFHADRQWRNLEEYALAADEKSVLRQGYLGIAHRLRQSGLRAELLGKAGALSWSTGLEHMSLQFQHANDLYEYDTVTELPLHGFDPGRYLAAAPLQPRSRSQTRQHALFAEAVWQPAPRWQFSAGLRHDRNRVARQIVSPKPDGWDARYRPSSWRLGAVFQPDARQSLYAQASSGTDPVGTIATLSKASTRLRLTEGHQVELGYKRAGAQLEWTAALFQIDKDHILTPDPLRPRESVQGGSQRSRGIELGAVWVPAAGWRVEANTTLLQARYTTLFNSQGQSLAGNRPANVPERLANLWLGYRESAYDIGAGLRHVGRRYTAAANSQSLPGYRVIDASLGWRLNARATLRLHLRNLSDELYATGTYTATQAMLGKPRSADLVLDYRVQ
ncbi:TonB-dependent receptor [Paucibacter sp. PLA-PC-4]|uniref:TonB-dependent receptor n=1 Tax=Paucibacter sp. PLA-PC-4 TaxID=2993655 RepID=UPI0022491550|nr:TonB-dependent receptor [Paucibacter sp. PLA-PC-4]MCX2863163.1 TonB-dependent receptor [Paucibacter sp. PLA-PC-4]